MSTIQSFTDMSGRLSQNDINSQNVQNIINEFNRLSDRVDSLNNSLSVIAYGQLSYSWDGTILQTSVSSPIVSTSNFMGLCYMSRSSESNNFFHGMPFTEVIVNGAGDSVDGKIFLSGASPTTGSLQVNLNFYATGSPETFIFYYLVIQQPADVPS